MSSLLLNFRSAVSSHLSELRLARRFREKGNCAKHKRSCLQELPPFHLVGRRPGHHVRGGLGSQHDLAEPRLWKSGHLAATPDLLSSSCASSRMVAIQSPSPGFGLLLLCCHRSTQISDAPRPGRQRASHHEPGAAKGHVELWRLAKRNNGREARSLLMFPEISETVDTDLGA